MEGRHVGLDFYDLLIEAIDTLVTLERWSDSQRGDAVGSESRNPPRLRLLKLPMAFAVAFSQGENNLGSKQIHETPPVEICEE
jgi:hypothetical protein